LMKTTYIKHSSFAVELEDRVLLFDYYKGELPEFSEDKKLYVFASHGHGDHYSKEVFKLRDKRENACYIFSGDILSERKARELDVVRMTDGQERKLDDMTIRTFKSTDEGVAFLIYVRDKVLYHAGDLHWWHWEGEPDEDNLYMEKAYKEEIEKMKNEKIDLAFLVLDPRQEEAFYLGFDWFMRQIEVKAAVPMHMWGEYGLTDRFMKMDISAPYRDRVWNYDKEGESVVLA